MEATKTDEQGSCPFNSLAKEQHSNMQTLPPSIQAPALAGFFHCLQGSRLRPGCKWLPMGFAHSPQHGHLWGQLSSHQQMLTEAGRRICPPFITFSRIEIMSLWQRLITTTSFISLGYTENGFYQCIFTGNYIKDKSK